MKNSLNKKSFSFNVLILAGGTAFAQAIGLLVVPLLTRLYSPSDFGNYALYTSAFNLLAPLAHFRYASAIMLPKEDSEAIEVLRLSLRLSILFGITLFVTVYFILNAFNIIQDTANNISFLFWISFVLILGGTVESYTNWANRMKNYLLMSLTRATQVSGMVLSQSLAGYIWGSTLLGLMFGHIFGLLLGLGIMIRGNKSINSTPLYLSPVRPLIDTLVLYKRFPLFTFFGNLLDGLSSYGTPLLLAMYFHSDTIGKYALANTIISAPVSLIGYSISQVLYQKMSETLNNGLEIKNLVLPVFFRQSSMALLMGSIIYLFGPFLFSFFFGDNWVSSGQFAIILIPAMFSHFIVAALSTVLLAKERQDLLLYAQIVRAFLTAVSIVVPGMLGQNVYEIISIFSITRTIANSVYLALIFKVAHII